MKKTLTQIAIENNRVTWIAMILLILSGIFSYLHMPRSEDPSFILRIATVVTYFPGASPARMEQLITDKLEKEIKEMPELDFITSTSMTGVSVIYVNIKESITDLDPVWDRLRRKVDSARTDLPTEIIGPVVNDEFADVYGVILNVVGDGTEYSYIKEVAEEVRDELLLIEEVAKVELFGVQDEQVFVEYDNSRLSELGLSPYQLSQILQGRNIIIPGGDIAIGNERIALEPSGNFESVAELEKTVINIPGSQELVYLSDIATIKRGYVDPATTKVNYMQQPAISLGISLRDGGNILVLGKKVRSLIKRLKSSYPYGIEFEEATFQPDIVKTKIDDFVGNLGQSILVVALVMVITLGLRTGLVVSSLVPATIIISIMIMRLFDIWLDQVSLASLIIALGMLVDNAIVIAESIIIRMQEGKERIEAAIDSVKELKIPLLTSSLTTAAAFFPIYLAESMSGEYTQSIFKVVTITLLTSWILSMTFVPLLCVITLKIKEGNGNELYSGTAYIIYRIILSFMIRHKIFVGLIVFVIFAAVMGVAKQVPQIFFPPSDRAFVTAEFELPEGSSIEATEAAVQKVSAYLQMDLMAEENDGIGVLNWTSYIGQGGPRYVMNYNPQARRPNYAIQYINIDSMDSAAHVISTMENYAFANLPDLRLIVKRPELGPPIVRPVEIRIIGRNTNTLFSIADKLQDQFQNVEGHKNLADNWGARTKKLLVKIDQERARRAGVSSQDIAVSLRAGLSGMELTKYREGDEIIPVVFRSMHSDRKDLGRLESMNVFVQSTGQSVPLKQVADIEVEWEYSKIKRRDGLRSISVHGDLKPGATTVGVISQIKPWLDEQAKTWPVGYRYELGGEIETSVKSSQAIADKMPIAGLIIIMLLVMQFNSVRKSLIILTTIPLGLIGVVIGLVVLDSYFGFMTLLGVVSLAGIVVNNAIVLIERIQIEITDFGREPFDAILEACQRRMRPIFLTTATTIGGLLPLYIGGGLMWEPMAIAIIFGLLFSTVLTLGVVPVMYAGFYRIKGK